MHENTQTRMMMSCTKAPSLVSKKLLGVGHRMRLSWSPTSGLNEQSERYSPHVRGSQLLLPL
jgi:hypothetical protein